MSNDSKAFFFIAHDIQGRKLRVALLNIIHVPKTFPSSYSYNVNVQRKAYLRSSKQFT